MIRPTGRTPPATDPIIEAFVRLLDLVAEFFGFGLFAGGGLAPVQLLDQ
ncbi:hypothetical protein [Nocardiopsis rhodophaea]